MLKFFTFVAVSGVVETTSSDHGLVVKSTEVFVPQPTKNTKIRNKTSTFLIKSPLGVLYTAHFLNILLKSILYLNNKITKTDISATREVIANLTEKS